jgi:hypothetical protein
MAWHRAKLDGQGFIPGSGRITLAPGDANGLSLGLLEQEPDHSPTWVLRLRSDTYFRSLIVLWLKNTHYMNIQQDGMETFFMWVNEIPAQGIGT